MIRYDNANMQPFDTFLFFVYCRYLCQINVLDLKTGQVSYFVLNDWLTPYRGDFFIYNHCNILSYGFT